LLQLPIASKFAGAAAVHDILCGVAPLCKSCSHWPCAQIKMIVCYKITCPSLQAPGKRTWQSHPALSVSETNPTLFYGLKARVANLQRLEG